MMVGVLLFTRFAESFIVQPLPALNDKPSSYLVSNVTPTTIPIYLEQTARSGFRACNMALPTVTTTCEAYSRHRVTAGQQSSHQEQAYLEKQVTQQQQAYLEHDLSMSMRRIIIAIHTQGAKDIHTRCIHGHQDHALLLVGGG